MKKIFTLILLSAFIVIPATAEVNMPGEPNYSTTVNTTDISSSYKKINTTNYQNTLPTYTQPYTEHSQILNSDPTKAKLDSLAKSVLQCAEKHDNTTMNQYIQKMMQNGAEGFSTPQVIQKKTPHCPPIKIKVNGRQLSGNKCALFGYLYKGKQYEVGYCK